MLKLSFFLAAMLFSSALLSQQQKNDVYFEFLGNGIGPSFNYERGITKNQQLRLRIGVGYFSGDERFRLSFPAGVSYLIPLKNKTSFIDAGIGITNSNGNGLADVFEHPDPTIPIDTWSYRIYSFVPSVGFRKHTKHDWMWRVSFTPVINEVRSMPWGGISIGKRF